MTDETYVVFHGQADLPWLRLLRPGFRHCYAVLRSGGRWLSFDPMLNRLEVRVHAHLPLDFDLPGWLAARGHTVVRAVIDGTRSRPAPWRPFTCVEAVKRLLGLHARAVLTPWQLYRHLIQPEQAKETRMGSLTSSPKTLPTVPPAIIEVAAPEAAKTSAPAAAAGVKGKTAKG